MLDADQLRALLHYDLATGVFIWRVSTSSRACAGAVAGTINDRGYRRLQISGKRYYVHRLAWLYVTGEWPTDDIDHIDLNRANNRFSNLRPATRSQNLANTRPRTRNSSGLKGVSWNRNAHKWRADICIDGKTRFLGYFTTPAAAHDAYNSAATEHHGDFARGS